MRKHVAAIMGILVVSTVISVAAAEPDGRGQRNGGPGDRSQMTGERLEHMANRLGLDETQKQQIENIQLAAQPELDAIEAQMQANRETRKALAERIRSEVDAVLTDEQRSQLAEQQARRNEGRARRPGKDGDNAKRRQND